MNHIPICVRCHIECRVKKNGVFAIEMASFGPAAIWMSDLWHCPECGIEFLAGFGQRPACEHYQADFQSLLDSLDKDASLMGVRFWGSRTEQQAPIRQAVAKVQETFTKSLKSARQRALGRDWED